MARGNAGGAPPSDVSEPVAPMPFSWQEPGSVSCLDASLWPGPSREFHRLGAPPGGIRAASDPRDASGIGEEEEAGEVCAWRVNATCEHKLWPSFTRPSRVEVEAAAVFLSRGLSDGAQAVVARRCRCC
ncbi:unnamed protein product [Lampetra planeri]